MTILIIFIALSYLLLFQINNFAKKTIEIENESEFQRTAVFIVDSMIKNSNEKNPSLGSAFLNKNLKRTENNIIDFELLKNANSTEQSTQAQITKIQLKYKNKENEIIFDSNNLLFDRCLEVQRFILIKKLFQEKALLVVTICNEK